MPSGCNCSLTDSSLGAQCQLLLSFLKFISHLVKTTEMVFFSLGQIVAVDSIVNEVIWILLPFCEASSKLGQSPLTPRAMSGDEATPVYM